MCRYDFAVRFSTFSTAIVFLCLPALAATNFVSIKDSAFIPPRLAVYPGDTVTWTQDDSVEHTVTSTERVFNSGSLQSGEAFSFTFDQKGDFSYYCIFHGAGAMSGAISVVEPTKNTPPQTPANTFPMNGATNQPMAVELIAGPFSDPESTDFHAASQWLIRYASNQFVAADSGPVSGSGLTNYTPSGLIEETTYTWQVRYKDGRGAWSEYSEPTRFTTLAAYKIPGIGLHGVYYSGSDFTKPLVATANEPINFDGRINRPHRRITTDDFAVSWEGAVLPKFSELYQFEFEFRGRARLWLNNEILIDDWTPSPFILARRAAVRLVAGQFAPIRIEYAAHSAGALAILRWMSPSVPTEIVPTARLYPAIP